MNDRRTSSQRTLTTHMQVIHLTRHPASPYRPRDVKVDTLDVRSRQVGHSVLVVPISKGFWQTSNRVHYLEYSFILCYLLHKECSRESTARRSLHMVSSMMASGKLHSAPALSSASKFCARCKDMSRRARVQANFSAIRSSSDR